jgi:hypothetical protein
MTTIAVAALAFYYLTRIGRAAIATSSLINRSGRIERPRRRSRPPACNT